MRKENERDIYTRILYVGPVTGTLLTISHLSLTAWHDTHDPLCYSTQPRLLKHLYMYGHYARQGNIEISNYSYIITA